MSGNTELIEIGGQEINMYRISQALAQQAAVDPENGIDQLTSN